MRKRLANRNQVGSWWRALTLLSTLVLMVAWSSATRSAQAETVENSLEFRRTAMVSGAARHPWPSPVCSINQPSACLWGKLSLAMTLLEAKTEAKVPVEKSQDKDGTVDTLLRDALGLQATGFAASANTDDARKQASEQESKGIPAFHFLTSTLLHRLLFQFGPARFGGSGLLKQSEADQIVDLFARWAPGHCQIADTSAEMAWRPWGSENHDLQRAYTCWASANLLIKSGGYNTLTYNDGSTPPEQLARWTVFLKTLIRARAMNGGFIEFFSPTYIKYDLSAIYNIYDSSDDNGLKALSANFATLWWAMWGQEQVGGAHGGSKARRYDGVRRAQFFDGSVSWLYSGRGQPTDRIEHPAFLPLIFSSYRPPQIVLDLIANAASTAPYEVWTRELGLAAGPSENERYNVEQSVRGVTRYTYVTKSFIMGTVVSGWTLENRFVAISGQNRWNGLTLLGPRGNLVFARPTAKGGRSTYNAISGTQKFGTQIVQALPPPYGRNIGDMVIYFSKGMRLVERGGWIFAADSAFVAARPAFGGYKLDMEKGEARLQDNSAPVIIQAAPLGSYPSLEAFQAAILSAKLTLDNDTVTFSGLLDAGDVSLPLGPASSSTARSKQISAPDEWTLYSPFITQRTGSPDVTITFAGKSLRLSF